jgi:hypothetical protein
MKGYMTEKELYIHIIFIKIGSNWRTIHTFFVPTNKLFRILVSGKNFKVLVNKKHLFFYFFIFFCVLTPLSAIFQLYHGDHDYLERTTDPRQANGKLYHLRLRVECTLFCNLQSWAIRNKNCPSHVFQDKLRNFFGLGLWSLMPLSKIIQLYRGSQFNWWMKPEYLEKICRPVTSHWQTLSHNVVSSTPRHEQDSNKFLLGISHTLFVPINKTFRLIVADEKIFFQRFRQSETR